MYGKTLEIFDLSTSTARTLAAAPNEWMAYLRTAGRLYKYPYQEQLLIYAQRPDATACAEYTGTVRGFSFLSKTRSHDSFFLSATSTAILKKCHGVWGTAPTSSHWQVGGQCIACANRRLCYKSLPCSRSISSRSARNA